MNTQWQNFLKNSGEWHGSFTQFSPLGIELSDTPSILTIESLDNNQSASLTLERFYQNQPPQKLSQTYTPFSLSSDLTFFDDGSFCRGNQFIYPYSTPILEFSFIKSAYRSRQVHQYNKEGYLEKLTLIREQKSALQENITSAYTLKDWQGKWQVKSLTLDVHKSLINEESFMTDIFLQEDQLIMSETIGIIDHNTINFEQSKRRITLLPNGAWVNAPHPIIYHQPCFFEVGWQCQSNQRIQLQRNYNEQGQWCSSTLIYEVK
ncbi:MAG: DUF3598 family protein [Microcystaceae cyanobacterium]